MTTDTLDMEARYTVAGHGGVAFYLIGYAVEWTAEEWQYDGEGDPEDEDSYLYCEPEQVENTSQVRAVMVGDDYVWTFGVEDLTELGELDYCACCGQIGCAWDGRDRA